MKNKSVKAMLATLAVTSAVTAQPAMITHAEEVTPDNEVPTEAESESKPAPSNVEEAKTQFSRQNCRTGVSTDCL